MKGCRCISGPIQVPLCTFGIFLQALQGAVWLLWAPASDVDEQECDLLALVTLMRMKDLNNLCSTNEFGHAKLEAGDCIYIQPGNTLMIVGIECEGDDPKPSFVMAYPFLLLRNMLDDAYYAAIHGGLGAITVNSRDTMWSNLQDFVKLADKMLTQRGTQDSQLDTPEMAASNSQNPAAKRLRAISPR